MDAQRIEIGGSEPYVVHVGRDVLASVAANVTGRTALLSDSNVLPLHGAKLGALADMPRLALEPGEGSKTFPTVERVLDFLGASDLDRRSTLVALGGGVVGDVAGLAASLYMRGIALVQCPTSLVAQVDAALGGKTGVNLAAGKNLAGTFHAPRAVLADVETLATLPERELRSGLGEVVKTALVGDPELLDVLEERAAAVLARDPAALIEVVARCVRVKAAIVARDPREESERKQLNLGHTFGHAIELTAGFGRIPHGEAVAVGVMLALEASAAAGLLRDPELPRRIARLLERLGLPPSLDALRERHASALEPATLLASMRHDKKGAAGSPAFVLVEEAGRVRVDRTLDPSVLRELLGQ